MYPEDRVLVGVINRKGDLTIALNEHWYRIPQKAMPGGVHTEYLAFFLSGGAAGKRSGGIYYFAEKTGIELAYRKDLLPKEADKPKANDVYYKVTFKEVVEKNPPILNPSGRSISFIYTTWDRFVSAQKIADLYSTADYFVDRIYHALHDKGYQAVRSWDAERRMTGTGAQIRVLCQKGLVVASPEGGENSIYMDSGQSDDAILQAIRTEIARQGGPVTINIPLEGT